MTKNPQPAPAGDGGQRQKKKAGGCLKWGAGAIAVLVIIGMINGGDKDTDKDQAAEPTPATVTQTVEETAPADETVANVAEGVDPKMAPQEWYDQEVYRANNCASQSFSHGAIPMCAIRAVDTTKGGAMLVGYIDQDEEGVQDHFADEARRDLMIESFAGRVAGAKADGDPRVQHVTEVRIIASGGKGFGSGWQRETQL